MNKRYRIPIEHNGEKKVLEVGEAVYRQFMGQLQEDTEVKLYSNIHTKLDLGFVWASYIPAEHSSYRTDDLVPTKGMRTRYAKKFVNPGFYGTITFPAIKNVVPGTIKEMFQNPCAEVPLGTDEDFYLPIRKQAPAVIADPNMYPHKCPRCSAPAYIGFAKVDCSRKSCC